MERQRTVATCVTVLSLCMLAMFITGAGAALHGDNMQSVSEQRRRRHAFPHKSITRPAV